MGLSDLFKRRAERERVMPDPGSAEFDETIQKSEIPGSTGALGVDAGEWRTAIPRDGSRPGNPSDDRERD